MKNKEKARIWEITDYLISEHGAVVEFKYDEIRVTHPAFGGPIMGHTHRQFNNENIVEVLNQVALEVDAYGE